MNFFEILKLLCEQNGEKLTPLARRLGISAGATTAWKQGSSPSGEVIKKFANHFGVSSDYLLGITNGKDCPNNWDGEINRRVAALFEEDGNRKNNGRNRKALADFIGVSEATLGRWLLNGDKIPANYVHPIAEFFGVPVGYFLGISDTKSLAENLTVTYLPKKIVGENFEIGFAARVSLKKAQEYFLAVWKHMDSFCSADGRPFEKKAGTNVQGTVFGTGAGHCVSAGDLGEVAVLMDMVRRIASFDFSDPPSEPELLRVLRYAGKHGILDGEGMIRFESCIRDYLYENGRERNMEYGGDTENAVGEFRLEIGRAVAEILVQIETLNTLTDDLDDGAVKQAVAELKKAAVRLAA